jgi:hypothetical protein
LFALTDRSRRPVRYANQLAQQVQSLIVNLKRDKPHWGARKIRELLVRRLNGDVRVLAKSAIDAVLVVAAHMGNRGAAQSAIERCNPSRPVLRSRPTASPILRAPLLPTSRPNA